AVTKEAEASVELSLAFAGGGVFAMPVRTRGGALDVDVLGIAYLAGKAAGWPVIAGKTGGAPETITSDTGDDVDGNNVHELADNLVDMLKNPERAAVMGRAGRRHVEENWNWEVMGQQLRTALEPDSCTQ